MNTIKKVAPALLLAAIWFGAFLGYASADTITYQQPLHGLEISSSSASVLWKLGTTTAGILSSVDMWGNRVGATAILQIDIRCFTDSGYSSRCPNTEMGGSGHTLVATTTLASAAASHTVDFGYVSTSTVYKTFVANRYYDIQYLSATSGGAGVGDLDVYGTSSPNVCYASGVGHCTGSPYAYIRIIDADAPADYTTSYFTSVTSPAQSEVTASTLVSFAYAYWNTGYEGYDYAGVELNNISNGQQISVAESAINSTGAGTYSKSIVLITNNVYTFRPYLRNSSTGVRTTGQARVFYVVTNPGGQSLYANVDETNATSSAYSITGAFDYVGVFLTKFPINWVTAFGQDIYDLRNQTSTTSLPTMSIDFGEMQTLQWYATTSADQLRITYIDAGVFQTVSEIPAVILARTISGYFLWFGLVMFGVWEARNLFARPQG